MFVREHRHSHTRSNIHPVAPPLLPSQTQTYMREDQEEFLVSVNSAAVGTLTPWAWNVRPHSRIWCCSAPCRFPEAFNLAGAFTDQPDRQPAVRLRLRVPQVGVRHRAIVACRVSRPASRVEQIPQQPRNTPPLVFPSRLAAWWNPRDCCGSAWFLSVSLAFWHKHAGF